VVDLAVDEEISVGDYVVSGGELPALLLMDAMVRLLPGTLGNATSAISESHLDGLLDYPQYTRPERVRGSGVPELLLSGDHRAVNRWRRQQALRHTWHKRPDMLAHRKLDEADRRLLEDSFAADEEIEHAKK
jgi:tRNA (guanine37-N1)-methyltransferase